MPKMRLKKGFTHSVGTRKNRTVYEGGDIVELTETAAEAFADKFEDPNAVPVGTGEPLDSLTVPELKKLAEAYDLDEAEIEGSGSGGNVVKADWVSAIKAAREEVSSGGDD